MIWPLLLGGFVGASASGFVTSIGAVGTAGVAWTLRVSGVAGNIKGLADNACSGGPMIYSIDLGVTWINPKSFAMGANELAYSFDVGSGGRSGQFGVYDARRCGVDDAIRGRQA